MADHDDCLLLLDGMALIYRAHFAFLRNPMRTHSGLNTSPVFGYLNTLMDVLGTYKPTHVALALDTREPTFRHQEYAAYKAGREEVPEDVVQAVPYVTRFTEALGIRVLACPGWEADDIIGTLARAADKRGLTTYMTTPDKDFSQLVTQHCRLLKPSTNGGVEEWGVDRVLDKWGLERIDQVIDLLGLSGDTSDNIPGVPGIGDKTAQKLLAQFDTLEGVLAHVDELKGKQQERLREHADQARLSKRLVTIHTDAPIGVGIDDLRWQDADPAVLRELCQELEFMQLGERLLGLAAKVEPPPPRQPELFDFGDTAAAPGGMALSSIYDTIGTVAHEYRTIATAADRAALIADLGQRDCFCFDLETTSLDKSVAEIVGIAFSTAAHTGCFVPFPADQAAARAVLDEFRPLLEDSRTRKIGHNLKYDVGVLAWHDLEVGGELWDTMLAHYVIAPAMRHGMDELARSYLNYSPVSIKTIIGDGKDIPERHIREAPLEELSAYAAEDADVTWQLYERFQPLLAEHNAERVFREAEAPLVAVLVAMEKEGIALDTAALAAFANELDSDLVGLERRVREVAGVDFNLDSPKQLGEVLFDHLKLADKAKTTRTGQYATSEAILSRLAGEHEIVRLILDYRELRKLKNTYVDTLPQYVSPRTGRVHTAFSQAVTTTGRLASHDPNLQNIPIRTARGREIRKAFIPRGPEYVLLAADYSQIELRIIAAISGDAAMRAAFAAGEDVHRATAAKIYHCAPEAVDGEQRRRAKIANFGIAYGISAFGLAERLSIPRGEAADLIEEYYRQFPGVKDYIDRTIAFAREHGYVETLLGRRRYLRDIKSQNYTVRTAAERNAINAPIQGSAADMIKLAMIRIHRRLRAGNYRTRMLLQVHDELVFDLHRDEGDELIPLIRDEMRQAMNLDVPIEVEMGEGKNWLEAH